MQKFALHTTKPVAVDSPDHILPFGTKQDNSRNILFNRKLEALMGRRPLDLLDFGCAGGGFVKSCIDGGHQAVGLEGSDYSQNIRRAEWAKIPDNLFTCDVTAEFRLARVDPATAAETDARFDVITAWEFIEHIRTEDLPAVSRNALRHLKPGGLWIMSVNRNREVINGITLHQTVQDRGWWIDFFAAQGFTNHQEVVDYFGNDWVRGPLQFAPNSFHLVLTRIGEAAPPVPTAGSYTLAELFATAEEFLKLGHLEYPLALVRNAAIALPNDGNVLAALTTLHLCAAQLQLANAQAAARQAGQHTRCLQLLSQADAIASLLRRATGMDINLAPTQQDWTRTVPV
jgi:SAM-dependent methyltransferase